MKQKISDKKTYDCKYKNFSICNPKNIKTYIKEKYVETDRQHITN